MIEGHTRVSSQNKKHKQCVEGCSHGQHGGHNAYLCRNSDIGTVLHQVLYNLGSTVPGTRDSSHRQSRCYTTGMN